MGSVPHTAASIAASEMSATAALRRHWPEYLIEGWALGTFMISAGLFTTLFDFPGSPVSQALNDRDLQRASIGIAMGLTAMALIYSPWGKRSGAHMNPAVTLTFLRLGHVAPWDAFFYVCAQLAGGTLGVLVVLAIAGNAFADPPVSYITTVPGSQGATVAFVAELVISFLMMTMVLRVSNSERLMRYTGVCAGLLVATWICIEAPLSGMSMNPARSLAAALAANTWTGFWIYLLAPVAGMQAAAALHVRMRGRASVKCSKLIHAPEQRCIHCGYEPGLRPVTK